jgi:hypothetical protein
MADSKKYLAGNFVSKIARKTYEAKKRGVTKKCSLLPHLTEYLGLRLCT